MPDTFYRSPAAEFCQGDLLESVPQIYLKTPTDVLRKTTGRGARILWDPFPYPFTEDRKPEKPAFDPRGEFVRVHATFTRAVLLTYDCDLDNEKHAWIVALVRPIASIADEMDRTIVREGRNFSFFHLPEDAAMNIAEGYVDFRRITAISPDCFRELAIARLASMTGDSIGALQAQFVRFVTRKALA